MILRRVETIHPPVIGLWLYTAPGIDVEKIDAAVHLWSMRQWRALYEGLR